MTTARCLNPILSANLAKPNAWGSLKQADGRPAGHGGGSGGD